MKRLLFMLLLLPVFAPAQGIITTIAGNGGSGSIVTGVPATATSIGPRSCAFDKKGNLFFTDGFAEAYKIDAAGIITILAGVYVAGYNGDGIPATTAMLNNPGPIAVDDNGNIFINDQNNNRIRKIDAITGIITTVAGNGLITGCVGYLGGPATATCIATTGISLDKKGNLYLNGDYFAGVYYTGGIFKVDTTGILTLLTDTFSGTGASHFPPYFSPVPVTQAVMYPGDAICTDVAGNIYASYDFTYPYTFTTFTGIVKIDTMGMIIQYAGSGVAGYSGDGGPATDAKIDWVPQMAMDKSGNLYFIQANAIRRVDPSGMICTVAGNYIGGFSGDGGPATAALMDIPIGIATDTSGNIYIADANNQRVRKVTGPECGYVSMANVAAIGKGKQFSLYPNPATKELTITAADKMTTITIINLLGQTVYNQQFNSSQVQLDVSNLPKGLFFIKINGTEVRKFVKQ